MKSELKYKSESLPERCDICHKSDFFDAERNYCLRCTDINNALKPPAKKNIASRTIVMKERMVREGRRFPNLFTGLWFALAGFIPVAFFLILDPLLINLGRLDLRVVLIFVVLPVLITYVTGSELGTKILNQYKIETSRQASRQGLFVAASSFFLYILIYTFIERILAGSRSLEDFISTFFMIFLFGMILIGWLIAIVGAVAGWFLYKLFNNKKEDNPSAHIV